MPLNPSSSCSHLGHLSFLGVIYRLPRNVLKYLWPSSAVPLVVLVQEIAFRLSAMDSMNSNDGAQRLKVAGVVSFYMGAALVVRRVDYDVHLPH